jgi:hypothetical protein
MEVKQLKQRVDVLEKVVTHVALCPSESSRSELTLD